MNSGEQFDAAVKDELDLLDEPDSAACPAAAPGISNCAATPGQEAGTLAATQRYLSRGWAVVPVPPGEKAPRIPACEAIR
jgi:hypothetical protein